MTKDFFFFSASRGARRIVVPVMRSTAPIPLDETSLVLALQRGEVWAFDAVFEAYRPRVYGFLLRLCADRTLAEDLLQETFLRLARSVGVLRPDTRLRPYLFTIARNLYRSHRRWSWVDGERLLALGRRLIAGPATPQEHAAASELGRRLEATLAALPEASREVALLVLVEGLEPAEAAEILNLRPDAVRQRLARARAALADAIGESP